MENNDKTIGLIVAKAKNNVIGKNGDIPWRIKGEQKQFKELTTGNTVIMGRKTFESMNSRPLPNRTNIVISRTGNYIGENLITAKSLKEALEISKGYIYIIGGYSLYKEAIPLVDVMYITEINREIQNGDVFFPNFDENDFTKEEIDSTEDYTRFVYTKKKRDENS